MDNRAETEVKKKSGAVRIVRATINETPITIAEIVKQTQLPSEKVSMSLCHLLKRDCVERELINRTGTLGRKMVWAYKLKSSPPVPNGA
jgi:predicted DNA-binding transcriptional regulator